MFAASSRLDLPSLSPLPSFFFIDAGPYWPPLDFFNITHIPRTAARAHSGIGPPLALSSSPNKKQRRPGGKPGKRAALHHGPARRHPPSLSIFSGHILCVWRDAPAQQAINKGERITGPAGAGSRSWTSQCRGGCWRTRCRLRVERREGMRKMGKEAEERAACLSFSVSASLSLALAHAPVSAELLFQPQ